MVSGCFKGLDSRSQLSFSQAARPSLIAIIHGATCWVVVPNTLQSLGRKTEPTRSSQLDNKTYSISTEVQEVLHRFIFAPSLLASIPTR